jgi:hypothetical protein
MRTNPKITEEIQLMVVAAFGTVWQERGKNGCDYWQRVWDWLRTNYPNMCVDPTAHYPVDTVRGDITMLNAIFDWQNLHYKGPREWMASE